MEDIQKFEQPLGENSRMVILRGGLGAENPTAILNRAVEDLVGHEGYQEFVEIHMDNPWTRVIIIGMNELEFVGLKEEASHA